MPFTSQHTGRPLHPSAFTEIPPFVPSFTGVHRPSPPCSGDLFSLYPPIENPRRTALPYSSTAVGHTSRAMLGSGGVSDGYEVGSKRQRMMESNPYFAVGSSASGFPPYAFRGGFQPPAFPVVRLRGLPFNCTDIDIFKFFAGLDIVDVLLVNKNGRFSGEAYVVFAGPMQVEFALQRDRQSMQHRYVEVFCCKRQDYYNAVASEINYEGIYDNDYHGSPPPSRSKRFSDKDQLEYTEILKMRGLPYSTKKSAIVEFFKDYEIIEERIHIACRPDGKATGEAFVEFVSAEEAKRAMSKDKMTIGSRYVELFPSTPDEARRAESRSRQ